MMGNNTSKMNDDEIPSSISIPGRRFSIVYAEGLRSTRNSASSQSNSGASRRSSSRLNSASTTVGPPAQTQTQVQAPAPIAPMFPPPPSTTYPLDGTEFDYPPPSSNTTPLTPLPSWNTIPGANVVRGVAAVALNPPVTSNAAPAAVPNLPSAPAMGPPAQLGFIEDEEVEEGLEELEQQIETAKQERDAALQELEQVEAQEAANKKTANKTTTRRQPGRKVKTQSKSKKGKAPKKGCITTRGGNIRTYCPAPRNPHSDVPVDAPPHSTRSQRARRGGPEFGFDDLEELFRREMKARKDAREQTKKQKGNKQWG